jgi:hypothetical protein
MDHTSKLPFIPSKKGISLLLLLCRYSKFLLDAGGLMNNSSRGSRRIYEKYLTLTLNHILSNKKEFICKKYINVVYAKLNCVSENLIIILYFLQSMEFFIIKSQFSWFFKI